MTSDDARKKIDDIIYGSKKLEPKDHAEIRRLQLIIARNTLAGR